MWGGRKREEVSGEVGAGVGDKVRLAYRNITANPQRQSRVPRQGEGD